MQLSPSTRQRIGPYTDRRVLSIFVLGIAQGLPWVMIGSMLTLWLKSEGIGRAQIAYASLVTAVYAINFLWSPLLDFYKLPIFKRLSQRQGWMISCQLAIALCCVAMYWMDGAANAKLIVALALLLATFSATQDIAIDAYRVDSFDQHERPLISAAAGTITAGWWTGYAGLGFLPLLLSDHGWSWPALYVLMGGITIIICAICFLLPAPRFSHSTVGGNNSSPYRDLTRRMKRSKQALASFALVLPVLIALYAFVGSPGLSTTLTGNSAYIPLLIVFELLLLVGIAVMLAKIIHSAQQQTHATSPANKLLAGIMSVFVAPLADFFSRTGVRGAIMLLGFVFMFKLGEAFLGKMSVQFYKEVGFSNTEIGTYSKLLTWWLTIIFAVIAGGLNAKFGLVKGLFISGCAMASSNLMFAVIYWVGPDINLYIATICVDGFTQAWSLVAFVSFISMLCNHTFSATQYALLASLGNLGRTTLGATGGQIVDWLNGNWALFFIFTALLVIPSLLLLLKLRTLVTAIEKGTHAET